VPGDLVVFAEDLPVALLVHAGADLAIVQTQVARHDRDPVSCRIVARGVIGIEQQVSVALAHAVEHPELRAIAAIAADRRGADADPSVRRRELLTSSLIWPRAWFIAASTATATRVCRI
jgi:hypothetical protein